MHKSLSLPVAELTPFLFFVGLVLATFFV